MNGIATITLDGKSIGLKFGMPAVRRFFGKVMEYQSSDSPLILENQYTDFGLVHILYAGYMNDCLMKDQSISLSFAAFYEFVEAADDSGKQEIRAVVAVFEASRYIKPIVDDLDEKKKSDDAIDWDDIESFCYGDLGYSPAEYYRLTWREYILSCRGFNTKRSREYEHTRLIVYTLASQHRDPKKKWPKIEEFMPLPTDSIGPTKAEEEEGKRLYEKLQKFKESKFYKR